jgi:hypothetical protein
MSRLRNTLGLALFATVLTLGLPAAARAQVVVVQSPPVYTTPTYVVPATSYYSVPVTTYAAPRVAYYTAPATTYYAAPVTSYYAAPATTYYAAPVTSYYAAPVVTAAPGYYTTYTYRYGLGIFRPRYVTQTYYTPVYP